MKRNLKRKLQIAEEVLFAGIVPDVGALNQFNRPFGTGGSGEGKPRSFTDPIPKFALKRLAKKMNAQGISTPKLP